MHIPTVTLISDFWAYAHTKEYLEGLFVEASGLVLDVFLLIISVKLIAYYLARHSRSMTSFVSSIFIAQFLRDVLLLQLKSGGISDVEKSLDAAFRERKLDSRFSHFLYGNFENLLELLRVRMKSGEHIQGHRTLKPKHRKDMAGEACALLARLDNLLVILASLRQEEQCHRAYEFRLVLTAVSDYLENLSNSTNAPPPRTYALMSTALASTTESWFKSCKKVLDRKYNGRLRASYVHFLLSLPWEVSYRLVMRRWKRLRGQPYTDPFASNFPQLFCISLVQAIGPEWNEIITASGIESNDFRLLITQHKALSQDSSIALLERIRPYVPADLWDKALADSLTADVDSRHITMATVDAIKATALCYFASLSSKDENSAQVRAEAFKSLWNLRSYSK